MDVDPAWLDRAREHAPVLAQSTAFRGGFIVHLAHRLHAVGWSGYFVSLTHDLGVDVPASMAGPPGAFNLPAFAIVLMVAALLVIGIKQSADTNTLLVAVKSTVLVVFVVAGAAYINRANLTPFIPPNTGAFGQFGWSGILRGAGVMFSAAL